LEHVLALGHGILQRTDLREALERLGWAPSSARDAESACRQLEEASVACLLASAREPGCFEMLAAVRAGERGSRIPTLFLEARGAELPPAMLRAGLDDWLPEAAPLELLVSRLRMLGQLHELAGRVQRLEEDLRQARSQLVRAASRDPLTGLLPRAALLEQVDEALAEARRRRSTLAFLFVDVLALESINEAYGDTAGDSVLRQVAGILAGTLQGSASLVGRYAGEEFLAIVPEAGRGSAVRLADELRDAVAANVFEHGGRALGPVKVSIGVAEHDPARPASAQALIGAARRAAMVTYWMADTPEVLEDSEMAPLGNRNSSPGARLLHATLEQSGKLFFQPILGARDDAILGYEALIRVNYRTVTNPFSLFALAEQVGIVRQVSRALRAMSYPYLDELPEAQLLFINLHAQDLSDPRLGLEELPALSDEWRRRIVFELTERAALGDFVQARRQVEALRGAGTRIAIDDLGAGYSGLSSLANLTPEFVKLDMSLIRGIHQSTTSRNLIRFLMRFARDEGLKVIAEGVEQPEERDCLIELGCDYLQGYLLARPGPPFPLRDRWPRSAGPLATG
jgi:diguanylate cyclase (GGDEF)-like protein